MLSVLATGSMVASLLAATSGLATTTTEAAAAPGGTVVEVVAVNGSGCPLGTGTATAGPDGSFTIITPGYVAVAGGAASPTDFRKNCQINVHVTRPEGWTYAVARVDSSGFVRLAAGARGISRVIVYFQGSAQTTALTHAFAGPVAQDWATADTIDPASLVYAACDSDRNLNIGTELRVSTGTSDRSVSSLLVRDPQTTVHLAWKRCSSA